MIYAIITDITVPSLSPQEQHRHYKNTSYLLEPLSLSTPESHTSPQLSRNSIFQNHIYQVVSLLSTMIPTIIMTDTIIITITQIHHHLHHRHYY